jgi:hypothetical protein
VTDEVRAPDVEMIEDRGGVEREERNRVRVDRTGLVARAVPALVVGDHLVAGVDEGGHLLRPQPLGVGPAVDQHHRRAGTVDLDVERDASGVDLHSRERSG